MVHSAVSVFHKVPPPVLADLFLPNRSRAEVDLVIDTGKTLLAIECKHGKTVGTAQLSGLLAFAAATKRTVASYVVFQGERSQRYESGVLAIPYLRFLREELPALET